MRYVTSGESHGRVLTAIVTGVPAGVPIEQASIDAELARRQTGYGRGGRQQIETDRGTVLSGVRFGRTIGSPVTIAVANRDWDNWMDVMPAFGEANEATRVTAPRPGHADLAGIQKIGSRDIRDVLERASARETAARVAAGSVAKALLRELGVNIISFVSAVGAVEVETLDDPSSVDAGLVESSSVRCPDAEVSERMCRAIDEASAAGESLGGVFYVIASGVLPGLGAYAEADRRLDARLAAAMMSIPAIKGVEIGDGFAAAALPGSQVHDEISFDESRGLRRSTNHAGGLEGGMSNGEPLILRVAMKPIPTLMKPLGSVDIETLESVDASRERSDVCAVPAAAVVGEAEMAVVLADAYCDKFGGDCLQDMETAIAAYEARIRP
ncbi:MAG: chorismate synthase [Coriobacteriia bacterium]|nr:chorismate synthase [Coriobacteriia bacterium]